MRTPEMEVKETSFNAVFASDIRVKNNRKTNSRKIIFRRVKDDFFA
jgi:hypothetical protein